MVVGTDVTISLGGTDYSIYIDTYSESGGKNQIKSIRTFGNNYEDIVVGVDDYELSLRFTINGTDLKTLYENATPITIILTLASEGSITYTNMRPAALLYELETDDLCMGTLTYKAPAFDGGSNNRVLA